MGPLELGLAMADSRVETPALWINPGGLTAFVSSSSLHSRVGIRTDSCGGFAINLLCDLE